MTKRLFAGFSLFLLTSLGPLSAQTGTQQQDPNAGMQSGNTAGTSTGGTTAATSPASDDQFVTKAAQAGLAEVELGRLASQKAQSPEVKQFAEQMVNDHTQANQQLKQAAGGMNIPEALDPEHQALKDKLSGLSGNDFDREYIKAQLKDHQEAISLFRSESDNGQGQLKSFAAATLPKIEDHARMVRDIASKLGIPDAASSAESQPGYGATPSPAPAQTQSSSDVTSSSTQSSTAESSTSSNTQPTDQSATASGVSPERHNSTYDRSKEMTNNNLDQFGKDKTSTNRADNATTGTTASSDTTGTMSSTQEKQSETTTGTEPDNALPRTASNVPLIGLSGLLSTGAAFILGLRRRWNN